MVGLGNARVGPAPPASLGCLLLGAVAVVLLTAGAVAAAAYIVWQSGVTPP